MELTELINIKIGISENDSDFRICTKLEPTKGLIKLCEELGIVEEMNEYIRNIGNSLIHEDIERHTLELIYRFCEEMEEKNGTESGLRINYN